MIVMSLPGTPATRSGKGSEAKDKFSRPLLIYDDMCSSCTKFAKTAAKLSRGWIRIAGHHRSTVAIDAKKAIFPHNYDSTRMFWLINQKGAFGARAGLIQTAKEIIAGNLRSIFESKFKIKINDNDSISQKDKKISKEQCSYDEKATCMSTKTTINRLFNMLKNSAKFNIQE